MSQNPLIDSGTQSSKTSGLNPALAAALASLEVQLDQELARYRRTRTGTRTLNQSTGSNISSASPSLTAIATISNQTQPSGAEIKINAPAVSVPHTPQGESAPAALHTESFDNFQLSSPTNTETQTSVPNSTSSIVPAVIKVTNSENFSPSDNRPKQPEDYLESSEALLRSLTEEPSPTRKPSNNSHDSLLSPLGLGSMLLLLMASLSLGYLVLNPKSLLQLNISKLFNGNSSPNVNNTGKPQSKLAQEPQQELTPIPKYPNLAAKEFPEVRDPNDVVGLKPKLQTPPTALPNPFPIEKPVNPTTVKPVPQVPPLAGLNSPQNPNVPVPGQPQPNAQIKPATDGLYHIVMDNQGDRAFSTARQIIPDAYLSLDNKLIYLGAFNTKEEAQQQLQQLQARGIKARVQQP